MARVCFIPITIFLNSPSPLIRAKGWRTAWSPWRTLGRPGLASILLVGMAALLGACGLDAKPQVHVWKSPTCTCCQGWVDYLTANGFDVEVTVTNDIALVKDQQGVPPRQGACHTAIVGRYVIEGHVPAEDLRRLLAERPDIRGLVLPGTPVGAPGLEGVTDKPYAVLALDASGGTRVFASHQPSFAPTWKIGRRP